MNQLYNELLLAHARAPKHAELLAEPSVRARQANPLCGDEIEIGAVVEDGRLEAIGFHASACAVCVASASVLCEHLRGRPIAALDEGMAALEAVLGGASPAADGPVAPFATVAAFPSRHGCALLPWRALAEALAGASRGASTPTSTPASTRPVTLDSGDAWAAITSLRARGEAVALATLVAIEGTGPCPVGSHMVIGASGRSWGAVSGGCVEPAVIQAAIELLGRGDADAHVLLRYAIADTQAGAVGLPCGGSIHVYLRRAPAAALVERLAAAASHDADPLVAIAALDGGPLRLVAGDALDTLTPEHATLARAALRRGPQLSEATPAGVFVAATQAQPRLILIGATHIAAKLAQLAQVAGLAPIIVDPRAQLAVPERFPGAEIRCEQPRRALPELLDARSSVVALTHDAKLDDPALEVALVSEAVYVAALGSRKTQRARLERLRGRGLPERALARLRGPAGLPIGAKGAAEIAVSILAELIAVRREAAARSPTIGAVLLAAGASRRAGPRNKLLHPIAGVPMIRRVATTVLAAGFDPCVVVLGCDAARIEAALDGLPVRFVVNHAHAEGMGGSIAAGVAALAEDPAVEGAAVVLGDMPYLRTADLEALRAAFGASAPRRIVAPEAGEGEERRLGNPVLWPRRDFADLAALHGDRGARRLLEASPDGVLRVAIDHPGVLRDVDVIE